MKEINLDVFVDEVIKTNKSIDKSKDKKEEDKEHTTLADVVSKHMLDNIDKFKDS